MTYIIENANILREEKLRKASFLIKDGKIASSHSVLKRYSYMKMDANPFIMTPSPVILNTGVPFGQPFQDVKKYYIEEFILKGCTVFLTMASIKYEYEISSQLKSQKTLLLNSPIDYIIGLRIPLRILTPSLIRKCKREKVPVVFVEVNKLEELADIPWGWVREAMFPFNSPLIPIFSSMDEREKKRAKLVWEKVMMQQKIPSEKGELKENEPLSYSAISNIGIFPLKSNLHQGCELTYNFYWKSQDIIRIEESELFHYHRNRLAVTVHKGQVIRAGENVFFRPGYGENVIINTPSFFKLVD